MSGKKTRDMKVRPLGGRPGALADFLLELSRASSCLKRLGEVARALPDGDEFYTARNRVGGMLNELTALEERAANWGRS
jgi:hypothetical protein